MAGFNPGEPRDEAGRWSTGGAGSGAGKRARAQRLASRADEVAASNAHLHPKHAAELHGRLAVPDGGFTVDTATGKDQTTGYMVAAHPERSKIIPAERITPQDLSDYAAANSDLLSQPGMRFGAWHDPESGNVYLDISAVVADRAEAVRLGRAHNQKSILHLDTFEFIDTGGTGEVPEPGVENKHHT